MEEIDIWSAAQQLIKRYNQGAFLAACQRADAALNKAIAMTFVFGSA